MDERDDDAHHVRLTAKGMEQRGKGAANATVTASLHPVDGQTQVAMEAEITLSGAAAQLSRGLLPEVSKQLTARFAECLRSSLDQGPSASEAPFGGVRLGLSATWAAFVQWLRRLFGRRSDHAA